MAVLRDVSRLRQVLRIAPGYPAYVDGVSSTVAAVGNYLRTHEIGNAVVGVQIQGGADGQFFNAEFFKRTIRNATGKGSACGFARNTRTL